VREAAIVRRRGEPDPLTGVERLDVTVLERLGISRARLNETVVSDAVHWAATLNRVGRDSDAAALLDAAAAVEGAPARRELARSARGLILKRALRHWRFGEAARELGAYARGR
jgi:hypothetical protein